MKNNVIALLILLPAMVIAPLVKITKHQTSQSSQAPDEPHYVASSQSIGFDELAEFTALGSFAAANQGPYQITGYRHNSCGGTIAIMPLYRNAEGAAILKRLLRAKNVRSGIILSGKIYPNFPQLAYTVLQIKQSFNRLITQSTRPKPLFAFAESGNCQLAEKMINFTLT